MDIKIVEMGVGFEIRIMISSIKFYTQKNFETEKEAEAYLKEHKLEVSCGGDLQ